MAVLYSAKKSTQKIWKSEEKKEYIPNERKDNTSEENPNETEISGYLVKGSK